MNKRVVGAARILGDLYGRGSRELIALAFDEVREGEVRVQAAAQQRGQILGLRPTVLDRNGHGRYGWQGARTDLQHD